MIKKIIFTIIIFLALNVFFFWLISDMSFRQLQHCNTAEPPLFLSEEGFLGQTYSPISNKLKEVAIKPVKFNKFIEGFLLFQIENGNEEILFEKKINIAPLGDNRLNYIEIPENLLQADKKYTFKISRPYQNNKENPVSLWASKNDCYPGHLEINGQEQDNDLIMNFKYEKYAFPENIEVLKNRLLQYKPAFIKGNFIYFVFFFYELMLFICSKVLVKSYFSGKSSL